MADQAPIPAKDKLLNGGLAAMRVGTPTMTALALYYLMEISSKLDQLLDLTWRLHPK